MNHDHRPLQLPPIPIDHPAVAAAAEEYARIADELSAERRTLYGLEERRAAAEVADREALAGALRAGKRDPGQKALAEVDAALLASRRRLEALEVAVAASQADLFAAVEQHRGEWEAQLDAKVSEKVAAYDGALEGLARAHDELAEARTMSGWLARFPDKAVWAPSRLTSTVRDLTTPSGEGTPWEAVVAALRVHGRPEPERPAVTPMPRHRPASASWPIQGVPITSGI